MVRLFLNKPEILVCVRILMKNPLVWSNRSSHFSFLFASLSSGFKMSCMKKSVCSEPSVETADPRDEISSRCKVKVTFEQWSPKASFHENSSWHQRLKLP